MGDSAWADGLRSVRNLYYIGSYEAMIQEAESVKKDGEASLATGADIFITRAQLELDPKLVFKNVTAKASTALQAIKLLGTYRTASQDNKELVFGTLSEWLGDESIRKDTTLQVVAAHIYLLDGNLKDALKLLQDPGENLEKMALAVSAYLKMDRLDLAAKTSKAMQDVDDDDTLTQLATAWVNIKQGGAKVNEATFLLQELVEKFGPSVGVLNTLAVCQIHLKNDKGAFDYLKQARSVGLQNKTGVSPDTMTNTIVALMHMGKGPEVTGKIAGELKELDASHAWLATQTKMEAMFDQYAAKYK